MSDRSNHSRALVEAARGARPSAADRARLKSRLDARIALAAAAGAGALLEGSGAAVAATAAKSGFLGTALKFIVGAVVIGAVGGGGYAVSRARSEPAPMIAASGAANVATAAASAIVAATPTAAPSEPVAVEEPAAEPAEVERPKSAPAPASRRSQDAASIAAEVALLRKAQGALAKGDADASLKAIDALEKNHADGAMREEAKAARVLALCAKGKVDEARAEAQRFLAENPRSVQAPRVRSSCALAKPSK